MGDPVQVRPSGSALGALAPFEIGVVTAVEAGLELPSAYRVRTARSADWYRADEVYPGSLRMADMLGVDVARERAIAAFAEHPGLAAAGADLLAALRETDGDLGRTLDARADLGDALADAAARLRAYAAVKREGRAAISSSTGWLDQVKALAAELGGATAAFPDDPVKAADRLRQAHRAQVDRLRAEISRLGSELERTAKEDARLRSAAEVEAKLERHSEIRALLRYLEHGGSGEGVPYLPAAQQIRRRIETAEARIAELEARPDGREVARRAAEIAGLVGDLPAEQDPAAWLGEGVKREIARQQEAVAEEVRRALAYVDVGGDPSPLRCRVQAEAIRRKLCALVGAQVEAEAALAGAREALRNATERADAIREAAVRDAVSAVRDYDSYSGPMADDVAALAGSHARHAAQIRNLSAETTRLRSYATELEGVAADLRRELERMRANMPAIEQDHANETGHSLPYSSVDSEPTVTAYCVWRASSESTCRAEHDRPVGLFISHSSPSSSRTTVGANSRIRVSRRCAAMRTVSGSRSSPSASTLSSRQAASVLPDPQNGSSTGPPRPKSRTNSRSNGTGFSAG